ncbi:hypothetical protein V8E52_008306 [Russula decolorans]
MRTTSLVPVLAALISIASTFPIGHSAHQGRVAARDPARVRSPATPPNFVARAKPSPERRNHAPRQAPSAKHDQRDHIPRAAPSARQDRRNYAPRAEPSARHAPRAEPSVRHVPRAEPSARHAPRAEPSGVHHRRRDEHVPRHESDHTKRFAQDQNVFGNNGLGWDEDQCPAPLSACAVRGASDVDAIECVDLYSDLNSCGGCAADDIAYDCNAIPYARSVECVFGSCKVHSCVDGYVVAPPRDVCVPVASGAQ